MGRYGDNGYEGIYLEFQRDHNELIKRQTEAIHEIAVALVDLGKQASNASRILQKYIDSLPEGESE